MRTETIEANLIPETRVTSLAAAFLHIGVAGKKPGMTNWMGTSLGESVSVYDLNGELLFYDFPVLSRYGKIVGQVRASASRVTGVPVVSIDLTAPGWNIELAKSKAVEFVKGKYQGEVVGVKLVCYAYPKLGVAVEWKKEGRTQRTIFDITDLSIVPEKIEKGMRGIGAASLYERVAENAVSESLRTFAAYEIIVNDLEERFRIDLSAVKEARQARAIYRTMSNYVIAASYTRILTLCTHSTSHECFNLHKQERVNWCVVATGQMVMDFYRFYYQQNAIAPAMNTGLPPAATTYPGEISGYNNLTNNHFNATLDQYPTFQKVITEIDANRPFDYSYLTHAVACVGYTEQRFCLAGSTPQNSVYLYDPQGIIKWEIWGSSISQPDGFVFLRRT